jgi:uncharacterized protein with GYD domain
LLLVVVAIFHRALRLDFRESVKSSSAEYTQGDRMIFITLSKFRKKPTKATIAELTKLTEQSVKETGGKILGLYWTLGRYDVVLISEGKDEKTTMKNRIRFSDMLVQETLVGVSREEAIKLVE